MPRATTEPRPTPEAFLAAYPPQVQLIADRLRLLITATVPEIDEAVYVSWQLIPKPSVS
jgi:hypothetical protein